MWIIWFVKLFKSLKLNNLIIWSILQHKIAAKMMLTLFILIYCVNVSWCCIKKDGTIMCFLPCLTKQLMLIQISHRHGPLTHWFNIGICDTPCYGMFTWSFYTVLGKSYQSSYLLWGIELMMCWFLITAYCYITTTSLDVWWTEFRC